VLEQRALQRIQQKLVAVAKQRLSSSLKHETLARQGAVGREIVSTARKLKADLVVVGTRGRTGLQRVLLGSTAEYVLRHSPCPVLTVRHLPPKKNDRSGAGAARFRYILAPVDLLAPALRALRCAVNLASHLPARLTLLHVVSPVTTPARRPLEVSRRNLKLQQAAQAGLEKLARQEAGALLPVPVLVSSGVPEDEILQAAKHSAADLMVLGTKGRRGLKRLLLGSTAEAVVRQASCPVLVVRQPPRPRPRRRHSSHEMVPQTRPAARH
jgi:nucleotide-binding universal stress UspA family protein